MTSTVFNSGTVITAPWLNDVNAATYTTVPSNTASIATLNGATGSANVGYTPAGTSAVATTVQAKLRESVSVLDFIPVGTVTATTNCATWVQSAIDYCLVNGKALYVPAGTYALESQINVSIYGVGTPNNFVMYGDGWFSKFLIKHTGTGIHLVCDPSFSLYKTTIENLTFTSATHTPNMVIYNDGAMNTLLQDCLFYGMTITTACVFNDNAFGLTLQGCSFRNIVGIGVIYTQVPDQTTYSYINSVIDCEFNAMTTGIKIQGCNVFLLSQTLFEDCNVAFYADPITTEVVAFNITFDSCWFENNATYDIQLDSNSSYWCEASIKNCQFNGVVLIDEAHIQLGQKSKVTIEGTPAGNTVIVYGSASASATLIRAANFIQSGTYAWTSIDPIGNIIATTYKSLAGVYANPASGATVTLTTMPTVTSGTWLACVALDGNNSATLYSCVGIVTTQGATAVYSALKTATNLAVSVSGLNLQGNQTSGGAYSITWSLTRLA